MKVIQTAPLLAAFFLSAAAAYPNISSTAPPPPPSPSKYQIYVRNQCKNPTVLYPNLCYQRLAPFAGVIENNLTALSLKATNISISAVQGMISCLAHNNEKQENATVLSALADCNKTLATANDQLERSLKRMSGGSKEAMEAGDVKTWMSAALTNEVTCRDGLVASACSTSVWTNCNAKYLVENVTSNALAFVNLYYAPPYTLP